MPLCEQLHIYNDRDNHKHRKMNRRSHIQEHEYIAGICIHSVSLGSRIWLEYTYGEWYSKDYEESRVKV